MLKLVDRTGNLVWDRMEQDSNTISPWCSSEEHQAMVPSCVTLWDSQAAQKVPWALTPTPWASQPCLVPCIQKAPGAPANNVQGREKWEASQCHLLDFIAARIVILAWVGMEGAATISLHSHKWAGRTSLAQSRHKQQRKSKHPPDKTKT